MEGEEFLLRKVFLVEERVDHHYQEIGLYAVCGANLLYALVRQSEAYAEAVDNRN
jgi:hypothetical protein